MRFEGKVAIVTGGATGIGEAVAKKIASEGGKIIIVGLSDDPVKEVVDEIREDYKAEAIGLIKDLGNKKEAKEVVEAAIDRFGKLDVLISNASILPEYSPLAAYEDENFENLIHANIRSTYYTIKAALPELRKSKGSIVASGSVAGIDGLPQSASYAGTKAFIHAFVKSVAVEEGPNGIRANVVCPGPITTEMTSPEKGAMNEELNKQMKNGTVFGRKGTAEEAANVYAFLASEEATFVTGSLYKVDGAMTLTTGLVGEKASDEVKENPKGKLMLKHEVEPEQTYTV
ncbi:SDR family NAD(P)-dependent oxidoreductase [Cytophagaceae bacterium ABcell3]|nr:SDR family NAD(P)-dependent oxidoreductase [Cytophagaceae bacterium ABcell3]